MGKRLNAEGTTAVEAAAPRPSLLRSRRAVKHAIELGILVLVCVAYVMVLTRGHGGIHLR